jgi:hypothetical protein
MATQLFEIAISANALGLAFALTILFMVVAIFVPRSSLETGKGVAFSLAMVLHVLMVVIMLIAVAAYAVSSRWIYVLAPLAAVALSAKAINWIFDKRENKDTDKTKNIRWCKNCIHHKPSPRYKISFEVYGERKECPASPNYHVTLQIKHPTCGRDIFLYAQILGHDTRRIVIPFER